MSPKDLPTSTNTLVGFFDGASPTHYMTPWAPSRYQNSWLDRLELLFLLNIEAHEGSR